MESAALAPTPPAATPMPPAAASRPDQQPNAGTRSHQDPYQAPLCAHHKTHTIIAKTMDENAKILVFRRFGEQNFFSNILKLKFKACCHFGPSLAQARAWNNDESKGLDTQDMAWLATAINNPGPEDIGILIDQLKDRLKAENYTHLVVEANFEVPDGDLNNLYGICFAAVEALRQEAIDIKLIAPHGGDKTKPWNRQCTYYRHFLSPAPTEQAPSNPQIAMEENKP
jgi:hypothetical protein